MAGAAGKPPTKVQQALESMGLKIEAFTHSDEETIFMTRDAYKTKARDSAKTYREICIEERRQKRLLEHNVRMRVKYVALAEKTHKTIAQRVLKAAKAVAAHREEIMKRPAAQRNITAGSPVKTRTKPQPMHLGPPEFFIPE